jgi:hypothetical protein
MENGGIISFIELNIGNSLAKDSYKCQKYE